jgi:hypothetical protein
MFIKPPGIESLLKEGNSQNRLGDKVVRNARMEAIGKIEIQIAAMTPLPLSIDTVSPEPPYFEYFTYCDLLGGIQLQCGSAEITARILKDNVEDSACPHVASFNPDWAFDKYALSGATGFADGKIAFLPGSNLLHVIDQGQLARLSDEDWFVKPHPITTDQTLADLGKHFGYRRVFSNLISGHALFKTADVVATTQASEFFILAGLMGKPIVDLTKYEYSWILAYQAFGVVYSADIQTNRRNMERALMHPHSGWLHPDMSEQEIDLRISAYFNKAMEYRKPFKMVSTQRLTGRINNIKNWEQSVTAKQGPRLVQE